jgi:hypothetical protein
MESFNKYLSPLEILLRDWASIWFATSIVETPELQKNMKQLAYQWLREWDGMVILTQAEGDKEEDQAFGSSGSNVLMILEKTNCERSACRKSASNYQPDIPPDYNHPMIMVFSKWLGRAPCHCVCQGPIPSLLLQVALLSFRNNFCNKMTMACYPCIMCFWPNTLALLAQAVQNRIPDEGLMPLGLTLGMKLPTDSHATLDMVAHPWLGMYPFAVAASWDHRLDIIYSCLLVAHPQIPGYQAKGNVDDAIMKVQTEDLSLTDEFTTTKKQKASSRANNSIDLLESE